MKKWIFLLMLAMILPGCGVREPMETVSDTWEEPAAPASRTIQVELPEEAAVPTLEGEGRRLYVCQDYEICIETLAGGDLNRTVETLSGYPEEALTLVETQRDGLRRYDFVWACSAEEGERLGRAVILDDGNYHYTMTLLRPSESTENTQIVWRSVFESFSLAPV